MNELPSTYGSVVAYLRCNASPVLPQARVKELVVTAVLLSGLLEQRHLIVQAIPT